MLNKEQFSLHPSISPQTLGWFCYFSVDDQSISTLHEKSEADHRNLAGNIQTYTYVFEAYINNTVCVGMLFDEVL